MITEAEFEAAGLLDLPPGVTRAERLEVLRWFEADGFSLEEMVEANGARNLLSLSGDRALRPGMRSTLLEAADKIGVDADEVVRWNRILGINAQTEAAAGFTEEDIHGIGQLIAARQLFSAPEAEAFGRVLGASMSRIAAGAVSLFISDVEAPLKEGGGSELAIAQQAVAGSVAIEELAAAMAPLLRFHMEQAIAWSREHWDDPEQQTDLSDEVYTVPLAIGFVDLVGFTGVSSDIGLAELSTLIRDFESIAFDIVTAHGGRVVKLIGDEVMFTVADTTAGVNAALALLDAFADDRVRPRGGLAYGRLLPRGGDYYGPIVNLASRIADLALPYELLVTTEVTEATPDVQFEPAGRRQLKGFADPVTLHSVTTTAVEGT